MAIALYYLIQKNQEFWVSCHVKLDKKIAFNHITKDFCKRSIETGSLEGDKLPGFFKYDDSYLTGIGFESIGNGIGFFEFEFEWFGVTYTQDSNPEFAPRAEFNNGNLLGVRFFLTFDHSTSRFSLQLSSFSYEDTEGFNDGEGSVIYSFTSTRESSSPIVFLGFGLLFLGSFLTKKSKRFKLR